MSSCLGARGRLEKEPLACRRSGERERERLREDGGGEGITLPMCWLADLKGSVQKGG